MLLPLKQKKCSSVCLKFHVCLFWKDHKSIDNYHHHCPINDKQTNIKLIAIMWKEIHHHRQKQQQQFAVVNIEQHHLFVIMIMMSMLMIMKWYDNVIIVVVIYVHNVMAKIMMIIIDLNQKQWISQFRMNNKINVLLLYLIVLYWYNENNITVCQ